MDAAWGLGVLTLCAKLHLVYDVGGLGVMNPPVQQVQGCGSQAEPVGIRWFCFGYQIFPQGRGGAARAGGKLGSGVQVSLRKFASFRMPSAGQEPIHA